MAGETDILKEPLRWTEDHIFERLQYYRATLGVTAKAQVTVLHDVFGERPKISTARLGMKERWAKWHEEIVPKTARRMYETVDFVEMPILADMLEDAGCDRSDVLEHLRGSRTHVKGCWAIDFVLGLS